MMLYKPYFQVNNELTTGEGDGQEKPRHKLSLRAEIRTIHTGETATPETATKRPEMWTREALLVTAVPNKPERGTRQLPLTWGRLPAGIATLKGPRGCLCQLMELFVNLLITICAGVPYSNNGGYRNLAGLGGVYAYHFGGAGAFTGADADRVMELDRLFHQLKRPPYVFTMVCGGLLMVYACAALALGVFRVTYRWPPVLLGEALLNALIALGYIPGMAFYFIKLRETYDDPICKEREQMYKSKGHQGFECQFHGADVARRPLCGRGGVCFYRGRGVGGQSVQVGAGAEEAEKEPGQSSLSFIL
ncbi:hypothetical protein fugu_003400 [Takifugu bimaculatus]|uniref:MARVEL domain-containing protein n=1 Tax=Takifugu bimaculatus TaxID=433685 RepID=A0A4Z2BFD3_9TELE|nr:hypothetical protein fugu_003400 [Takifugu bimaculatus]